MTIPVALTVGDLVAQIAIQELPDLVKLAHAIVDAISAKSIAPAINAALQAGEAAADAIEDAKFPKSTT